MRVPAAALLALALASPAFAATPVDPTDPNAVQAAHKDGDAVTAKPQSEQVGNTDKTAKHIEKPMPNSTPVDPTDPNAVQAAKARSVPPG